MQKWNFFPRPPPFLLGYFVDPSPTVKIFFVDTKNQGDRLNSSAVRVDADGQTDGRMLPSTLSPCFAVDKKACI